MSLSSIFLLSLLLTPLPTALAGCNTPGYVPCPANSGGSGSGSGGGGGGGGGAALPLPGGGGGLGDGSSSSDDPVDSAAQDGILGSDDDGGGDDSDSGAKRSLFTKRQSLFCCRPSPVQCVIFNDGLPACFVSLMLFFSHSSSPLLPCPHPLENPSAQTFLQPVH